MFNYIARELKPNLYLNFIQFLKTVASITLIAALCCNVIFVSILSKIIQKKRDNSANKKN